MLSFCKENKKAKKNVAISIRLHYRFVILIVTSFTRFNRCAVLGHIDDQVKEDNSCAGASNAIGEGVKVLDIHECGS